MTDAKLYEIVGFIRTVGNALLENGGELTPELDAELRAWQGALDFRAANAGLLFLEMVRQAEAAGAEAKRLKEISEVRHRTAERLKEYIKAAMEASGVQKIKTDYCRLTLAANPPKVEPLMPEEEAYNLLGERAVRREVLFSYNKPALYALWKAGK